MTTIAISIIYLFLPLCYSSPTDELRPVHIYDYAWLAGSWTGDGFGGSSEEIWSPPSADGTMMGIFRHHDANGNLVFYEFMVLDSTGMRLKHFSPALVGWETKEKFVRFEMINFDTNRIELGGLLMERKSAIALEITLLYETDGKVATEVFHMNRNR